MLALDHIVQTVQDLKEGTAALERLGLRVVAGGRHAQWGTKNALCHLGISYIELLQIEDADAAQETAFGRAVLAESARGDGIWRLALRTDDISRAVQKVRDAGFSCAGPEPGARQRPDGSTLRWSLGFPELPSTDLVAPMLIDWHERDSERLAGLVTQGIADREPAASIAGIAVACRDPHAAADFLYRALGQTAREVRTRDYGSALQVELEGGDMYLCGGPETPQTVQTALDLRGERPFAVHLLVGNGGFRGEEISIGGARYTYAPL